MMNKNVTKRAALIVCILFGVIAVTALTVTFWPKQSAAQTDSATPKTVYEKVYYLKDYYGKIAVFEENTEKPFKITEAEVSALPVQDQKDLKSENGIKAQGQKELERLLRDYCS